MKWILLAGEARPLTARARRGSQASVAVLPMPADKVPELQSQSDVRTDMGDHDSRVGEDAAASRGDDANDDGSGDHGNRSDNGLRDEVEGSIVELTVDDELPMPRGGGWPKEAEGNILRQRRQAQSEITEEPVERTTKSTHTHT